METEPMTAEDDMKRFKRDQDRMFQEIEDKQRRSQQLITAKEFAATLNRVGLRLEQFIALERQLLKLGRLAGMSDVKAEQWAASLVRDARRLMLKAAH